MLDVLIIGGGVTGAGVLRDCAQRGLSALLVERGGFGDGTTGASSRLVHGGLRYLLYDRLTTHLTCWDSGHIVRVARPLLKRLPILWPVYKDHKYGLETVESLLESYDPFQEMKLGRPHLRLSKEAALAIVPGLKAEGLLGALAFDEWAVPPQSLVQANLDSAARHGGGFRGGCAAESLIVENGRVAGAVLEGPSGKEEVRAKVVVNAAGPEVNKVAAMAGVSIPMRLRRGTHLIYRKERISPVGLLLEAEDRSRYVFVLPYEGETLVGPTDVPSEEGKKPEASAEEIRYLQASAKRYFPNFPERYDATICGARPILGQSGDERLLSRDHQVFDHAAEGADGLFTITGGKLSSFRLMAEDTTDAVCKKLGVARTCGTHLETLEGKPIGDIPPFSLPHPMLKKFLAKHPYVREAHAMSHLAAAFVKHELRRKQTVEQPAAFWSNYPDVTRA